MKHYRFGFEPWALVLFLLIMLPNFYWLAVPAPCDILRTESVTPGLDALASVCQILFVAMLCLVVRRDRQQLRPTPLILAAGFSCIAYLAAWCGYYAGMTGPLVLLLLCLAPCLAFLLFALDRKHKAALVPICIFTACHLIYGVVNFIAG